MLNELAVGIQGARSCGEARVAALVPQRDKLYSCGLTNLNG